MTIKEILDSERSNFDSIVLYKEGLFWRVYERSAFNFVKHIKTYQLTKKYIKNVQSDLVYLGFPDNSLNSVLQLVTNKVIEKTEKQILFRPFQIDEKEFMVWKNEIILKNATRPTFQTRSELPVLNRTNSIDQLVSVQLSKFAVANKTPVECQQFIIELQNQLNGTV